MVVNDDLAEDAVVDSGDLVNALCQIEVLGDNHQRLLPEPFYQLLRQRILFLFLFRFCRFVHCRELEGGLVG